MRALVLIFGVVVLGTITRGAPTPERVLEEVIHLIEKGLKFFSEDYSDINVDGLFGLRIAQGQLKKAIEECGDGHCGPALKAKIVSLEAGLEDTCSKALPYVLQVDSAYFNRFEQTITKPYIMDYRPAEFDVDPVTTGNKQDYNEDFGDECYGRVMGTYMEDGIPIPKCNVTRDCWAYMTQHETSQYFITHQLLYFIIVGHVGCQEEVEQQIGGKTLYDIETRLCRYIYEESKQLEQDGAVNPLHQDLFLEQTVLCGPLGFEDFMRPDWMKMVMSWPDKVHGCFKLNVPEFLMPFMEYENLETGDAANTADDRAIQSSDGQQYVSDRSTMRKVLRERKMADGCLSHTSGLGFGALCTYLRYLVRYI